MYLADKVEALLLTTERADFTATLAGCSALIVSCLACILDKNRQQSVVGTTHGAPATLPKNQAQRHLSTPLP